MVRSKEHSEGRYSTNTAICTKVHGSKLYIHLLLFLLTAVAILTIVPFASADAESMQYTAPDGVVYELTGTEAVAIGYSGSIDSITIGPYVEYDDNNYTVVGIGSDAFYNCKTLTSVTIGKNVKSIASRAFHGCTSLTSVTVGEDVVDICKFSFASCTSLEYFNFNAIACNDFTTEGGLFANSGCAEGMVVVIGPNVSRIPQPYFFVQYLV